MDENLVHPSYHDMKPGMRFEEVAGKRRTVQVESVGIYTTTVAYTSPRGIARWVSVPNKRLSNPAMWRYLGYLGRC